MSTSHRMNVAAMITETGIHLMKAGIGTMLLMIIWVAVKAPKTIMDCIA
jgi:hypothetical protein